MENRKNNRSLGDVRSQHQTRPYRDEGTQASGLISKVMGLLACSFLSADVGALIGMFLGLGTAVYYLIFLLGFVVFLALQGIILSSLQGTIQKPGIKLFLLYLLTFLEGMALAPLMDYSASMNSNMLGQTFFMAAIVALGLSFYAFLTKRDFTRISDSLFTGVIILLAVGSIGLFFHTSLVVLIALLVGTAIFFEYVLYSLRRSHDQSDTLPNAINLTVRLFLSSKKPDKEVPFINDKSE